MDSGSKRIMVAGGAGFLGANLCKRLLQDGHRVTCLDNFQTGRLSNVQQLRGGRFEIMRHDLTEELPAAIPPRHWPASDAPAPATSAG